MIGDEPKGICLVNFLNGTIAVESQTSGMQNLCKMDGNIWEYVGKLFMISMFIIYPLKQILQHEMCCHSYGTDTVEILIFKLYYPCNGLKYLIEIRGGRIDKC